MILCYQRCCIWCWCHQMHWRGYLFDIRKVASDRDVIKCIDKIVWKCWRRLKMLTMRQMSEMLHPIAMQSDALTKLDDAKGAAPNAEAVECTGKIVWWPEVLQAISYDRMHWQIVWFDADWECWLSVFDHSGLAG